jgi:hypothetical protein
MLCVLSALGLNRSIRLQIGVFSLGVVVWSNP